MRASGFLCMYEGLGAWREGVGRQPLAVSRAGAYGRLFHL